MHIGGYEEWFSTKGIGPIARISNEQVTPNKPLQETRELCPAFCKRRKSQAKIIRDFSGAIPHLILTNIPPGTVLQIQISAYHMIFLAVGFLFGISHSRCSSARAVGESIKSRVDKDPVVKQGHHSVMYRLQVVMVDPRS